MEQRASWPTPYPDVNVVLAEFLAAIRGILGRDFTGMYLYGSLALGDFDTHSSDLDFLVATREELTGDRFHALRAMHMAFDGSGSRWAGRVEAAYIPLEALQNAEVSAAEYPQIEKGGPLLLAPLEVGWPYQAYTLREFGVIIEGPHPRELIAPVAPHAMRDAAAAIVDDWLDLSGRDPEWLAWLRDRSGQAFVTLTLCRLLYSLATGSVASKAAAARAAASGPARHWAPLIERSLALQHRHDETPESDVEATLALLRYTAERLHENTGK